MVDPPRIIRGTIAPRGIGEIPRARCQPDRTETEGIENEVPQGTADVSTSLRLDELADKEISDIGITPAVPGIEVEAIRSYAFEHLAHRPRLFAAPDRLVVAGKIAIVGNAGAVVKQLAQRIWAAIDPRVEAALAACDELESCRGQSRLGEAPPWNARAIGTNFWSTGYVNSGREKAFMRHDRENSTPGHRGQRWMSARGKIGRSGDVHCRSSAESGLPVALHPRYERHSA